MVWQGNVICEVRNTFLQFFEEARGEQDLLRSHSAPPTPKVRSCTPSRPISCHVIADVNETPSLKSAQQPPQFVGSINYCMDSKEIDSVMIRNSACTQDSYHDPTSGGETRGCAEPFPSVAASTKRIKKRRQIKNEKRYPGPWVDWWRNVPDTCPLSHFPISLLPFPPFKLCLDRSAKDEAVQSIVFIDGQFLVYQVLSTWNFKVLGIELTEGDIMRLDSYIKGCKLGRLRIGEAIALKKARNPEADGHLAKLRELARVKLMELKQIKRLRLRRMQIRGGSDHEDEQTLVQSNSSHAAPFLRASPSNASMVSTVQPMCNYAAVPPVRVLLSSYM